MASASSAPYGYRWEYLSWELHRDSYKETFFSRILPLVKPEWRPDDLDYHVFESGVTNTLVGFFQKNLGLQDSGCDVVLLRLDGAGTEDIINRTDEVVTILSLHEEGFCPPLYLQLKNGLCYGFSPGRRLKVHETTSNSTIMRKIAGVMAKLHSLEIPTYFKDREPFLWIKITQFLKMVPTSFLDQDMQQVFQDSIGSIDRLKDEIEVTKHLILKECKSPVVFCHNDIHSANIIYNEETGNIRLVDYEYAGPNYLAYDIADHFCEFAGVEEVDYGKYPGESMQKMWISQYLEEVEILKGKNNVLIDGKTVHNLYLEVKRLNLGCHLLWVVWALFQAANSTLQFDFMEYASLRFKEYLKRKKDS